MIYDVFNFADEIELLEIRLTELDDLVDQFVLVECTKTFQNNPKELFFKQNKHLFEKWLPKIAHVIVDDDPEGKEALDFEKHHFNAGKRGTVDLKSDDIIMWGHIDELPNKVTVRRLLDRGFQDFAVMVQQTCAGYLNCWHKHLGWWTNDSQVVETGGLWDGTRIISKDLWYASKDICKDFRHYREDVNYYSQFGVRNGGWHFCNVGGHKRYQQKVRSSSHGEFNIPEFTDDENVAYKFQCCYNLYDPKYDMKMELMPWDMLPKCIYENRERFSHMLIPNEK